MSLICKTHSPTIGIRHRIVQNYLHINMYISIYIHMCIYISIYIYMCVYVSICIYIYMHSTRKYIYTIFVCISPPQLGWCTDLPHRGLLVTNKNGHVFKKKKPACGAVYIYTYPHCNFQIPTFTYIHIPTFNILQQRCNNTVTTLQQYCSILANRPVPADCKPTAKQPRPPRWCAQHPSNCLCRNSWPK